MDSWRQKLTCKGYASLLVLDQMDLTKPSKMAALEHQNSGKSKLSKVLTVEKDPSPMALMNSKSPLTFFAELCKSNKAHSVDKSKPKNGAQKDSDLLLSHV